MRDGRGATVAVGFALCLFLSSCSSIDAGRFDNFSSSTHDLVNASSRTYARIVDLQRSYKILEQARSGGSITESSFAPKVTGSQLSIDLKPEFDFRLTVLSAIAHYADALRAFAKKDYQSAIDSASNKLRASVESVGAQAPAAGALATAVDGLGHAVVEYLRVKALDSAMSTAQPSLETLAALLVRDNQTLAQQTKDLRDAIIEDANKILGAQPTPLARVEMNDVVAGPIAEADTAIKELKDLDDTITLIPKAHAELHNSLCASQGEWAELSKFVSEAQRLGSLYQEAK